MEFITDVALTYACIKCGCRQRISSVGDHECERCGAVVRLAEDSEGNLRLRYPEVKRPWWQRMCWK